MSLEYLTIALIVVLTPGTGVMFILAAGLARGARAGVIASVGCTIALVPHMLAAVTGVAAVLHASPTAFTVLKYLGVAYILFMAWSMLRDRGGFTMTATGEQVPAVQVIVSAVVINLLNPKVVIFFVAFLPQFVNTGRPDTVRQLVLLSAVFMLITFAVGVGYGAFASAFRRYVIDRPAVMTWIRRLFAMPRSLS